MFSQQQEFYPARVPFPLISLMAADFTARQWPCTLTDDDYNPQLSFVTGNGQEEYNFTCGWDSRTKRLKISCVTQNASFVEPAVDRVFSVRRQNWRYDVAQAFTEVFDLCQRETQQARLH